ncbi:MAG: DUF4838 domain-containing protein [Phycisphaerae bacterium]
MKRNVALFSMLPLILASGPARDAQPLLIAEDGRSDYRIVVAETASPSTRHAATELQAFLRRITGATLPIVSDSLDPTEHEIIVGRNRHLERLGLDLDFAALGEEGYVIQTLESSLVIAGSEKRGCLYGVYGLLEDHLGCRWFTPGVARIPERKRLVLAPIDEVHRPALEYREPFTFDCFDADWFARNRMNGGRGRMGEKHGGRVYFGSGLFVHTFNRLVPPDKFFDEHPEYFSEISGKRVKDHSQLCCTNEDVIRLCTEGVRKAMRADPDALVFSLSQNDWGNYCQCPACAALTEREGTPMGPLLHLVNRVAGAVADEFPGKFIETLAYQWSRRPPKTMRPAPNVIIRLCSIECCFSHPLATCDSPQNQAFRRDIRAWAVICDRLWVWDYCTSFPHYLLPFPNQHVRNDNIRFFVANNVKGIFEQDCYNTPHSELASLGGYLTAKFLWNPDYDEDRAINEFLEGYYGAAAGPIRRYLDLLHDHVEKNNIHVGIWAGPDSPHLTDDLLAEADRLWEQAEQAVVDRPEVHRRVRISRMSVDYAMCERARAGGPSVYATDHAKFQIAVRPAHRRRVERFLAALASSGMTRIEEWRPLDLQQYSAGLAAAFRDRRFEPIEAARVDEAALQSGVLCEYFEGHWDRLPDFGALKPMKKAVTAGFDLGVWRRTADFALHFSAYLRVPRDGVYTFYTTSDDGSRLYIGSQVVVENDGLHGARERSGAVALRAGWHPITVAYFQGSGAATLQVRYSGPEIVKHSIPPELLWCRQVGE